MNRKTLTALAERAVFLELMVDHYPDSENNEVTFPPSPYYRFLRLLAAHIKSRLSVELGVCGGGGSLHLAMASQTVVGIDHAWDHEANIIWIVRNYQNFVFWQGDSVALAPQVYQDYGQIDLLFIDTTHTYEQTMAEYRAYEPYLSDKAIVCLDDLFREGMDRAWNEMPDNKIRFDFLHPSQSPTDGGFGVIWK